MLNKYYYENKDLRLLLNLLAETSGPTTSLRVLALFDEKLNSIFKAQDLKMMITKSETQQTDEEGLGSFVVQFSFKEAPAMSGVFKQFKKYLPVVEKIMYNLEIFPPIQKLQKSKKLRVEIPIAVAPQSIPKPGSVGVDAAEAGESMEHVDLNSDVEQEASDAADRITIPKKIALSDLEISNEHSIRISTIVNGKTLAYQMASFGPMKIKEENSDHKIKGTKLDDISEDMEVQERPQVAKKLDSDFLTELKRKTQVPNQDQVQAMLVEHEV